MTFSFQNSIFYNFCHRLVFLVVLVSTFCGFSTLSKAQTPADQTKLKGDSLQVETSLSNCLLFLTENRFVEAQALAEASLDLATRLDNKVLMKKAAHALSNVFAQKGDNANSFLYLSQSFSHHFTDSIQKATAIQQRQIEQRERELALMRYHQARQMYLSIIIVLIVLGISFGGYMWSRVEKSKILERSAAEISEKNRRLESSLEVQRQFAHAAAHDLKEPLRNIGSFFNIIQKRYGKEMPEEAGDYFQFVNHGIKRMDNLLNALLDYSSISADSTGSTQTADVKVAVLDVISYFETEILTKNATIRYPSVLPVVRIETKHLKQIFRSLIANALKFNEQNPLISIDFNLKSEEFVFSIRDNGIGINEDYRHKIYHLFQRLDRTSRYEGTGVGLTICKNLVERYDGRIWFEANTEGIGTVFYLAFPKKLLLFDAAEIDYSYLVETNPKKIREAFSSAM